MSRLNYRPEIDGLRAIAVLAVLFYHGHLRVPGGYVGVDIFFVISGFLITSLIKADLETGTFSLARFWERRVRRIVPAASVMVLVSLGLGAVLMLPSDFAELARSAVAQALLVANVYFRRETGYFDAPAETQPLLHTWSLAVEEQFYLVLPLLLLGVWRWWRGSAAGVVAALAAVSFGTSVLWVWRAPDAAFYLLPARAWELAMGALLALRGGRLPLPERARGPIGWLGLALMVVPMFAYDQQTAFPGIAALPSCVGTVLVIWSTAEGGGVLKRLLSLRPVVFVGLISYSLYLWHWPVKVFSHYWFTGLYSPLPMRAALVPVSLGLAWLSWRFVELPFRARRGNASAGRWILGGVAASALTTAVGMGIVASEGMPGRFSPAVVRFADAYEDRPTASEADLSIEAAERGEVPRVAGTASAAAPSLLVWGDSHARVASPAAEAIGGELGVTTFRASRSATASVLNRGEADGRRYNAAILRWIEQHRPTVVVLVSRWEKVLQRAEDERNLQATVRAVLAAGSEVAIMRQVASQRQDIPRALAKATLLGQDVDEVGVPVRRHAQFTQRSNEMIDRVARAVPALRVLDPIPYLSQDGRCFAEVGGRPLYYDYQHLTRFGAGYLRPMFATLVRSVMAETRTMSEVDDERERAPGIARG